MKMQHIQRRRAYINVIKRLFLEGKIPIELFEALIKDELGEINFN